MESRSNERLVMIVAFFTAALVFPAMGRPARCDQKPSQVSLKSFLQQYLKDPRAPDDKTTRYSSALVDLNGNETDEVIVYLTGDYWCGSGGCLILILEPDGATYKVNTRILAARPPIRVLATKSHGWHDIAVMVGGGGILHAYEARLSFDGESYPISPANPPAQRLTVKVPGKIVIPVTTMSEGKPLYP
ncbi:MAG TPA: hypothetical protein VNM68_03160 [Candidatus Polarisedimenticolia bacterium]|nr:hypothetical protein [Candidatus Polarisedimenticolia bacterium]